MGSIVSDVAGLLDVIADDIDVADLAARLVVLAIKVDLRLWVALHHFADSLRHGHLWILLSTQHISHDRYGSQWRGGAKRQVQHGAQVLLEL